MTTPAGRVCVLCQLAVPTKIEKTNRRAPVGTDTLREEHARICTGEPPPEAVLEALVAADALVAFDFDTSKFTDVAHPAHPENVKQQLAIARAMYERKFKLALADDRGWYSLRAGIGERYVCCFCRVEIVEAIGAGGEIVAERLACRHATICALHFVGGLREPVLELPRNPDSERPDFK